MIQRKVSAVYLLRDGFTLAALPDASGTLCTLDGRPLRPIWKPGGYLVLTDLPVGEHTLTIRRRGFQDETRLFSVGPGTACEESVELRPGDGYPLPPDAVRVLLRVRKKKKPAANQELWLGMPLSARMKLGPDSDKEHSVTVPVFCQGNEVLLPIPGRYLVQDGKGAESVAVLALHGEELLLAAPMTRKYPRGTELIAIQRYTTDAQGETRAVFRFPGTLSLLCQDRPATFDICSGQQELTWDMESSQ